MRVRPALLLAVVATASARAAVVVAQVYYDTDGDGIRQAHEVGAPGVLVSDGDRILLTDADGRITLDVALAPDELRRVFVVLPGGHRATTPWHRLIDPRITDEQPVLFGLRPVAEPAEPVLAVTADPQVTAADAAPVARRLLGELAPTDAPPSAVVVLGDITEHGSIEELTAWQRAVADCPVPLYTLFGSRDGQGTSLPSIAAYQQVIGPAWYAFWTGGCCYIALTTEPGVLTGREQARQLRWLRRLSMLLPAPTDVVVLAHIPPAEPELQLLRERHRLRAVLYGYWHENSVWWLGETPMICTGPYRGIDWGERTGSFRRISVTDDQVRAAVFASGLHHELVVMAPTSLQPPEPTGCAVRVAAQDSRTEVISVEIEAGGRPQPLRRNGREMWRLDLPAVSWKQLKVRAHGRDGETWEQTVDVPSPRSLPAVDPNGTLRPPLVRAWLASTGAVVRTNTSVAVDGERLYVAAPDDSLPSEAALVALDARTGRELWRTRTAGSVRRDPVLGAGRVYALTHLNVAHALATTDGREIWRRELTPEPPGRHRGSHTGLALSPAGLLAQVGGGPLMLLDPATGDTLAKLRVGSAHDTVPATDGQRAVLATLDGLVGFDLPSRAELWRTGPQIALPRHSAVVIDAGVAYVVGPELFAFSVADGALRWRRALPFVGLNVGAPAVEGGVVYTGGERPAAWRASTGVPVWSGIAPAAGQAPSAPALSGDYVWVATDAGRLTCYDRAGGAALWSADLGLPVKSTPRIVGNALYLLDVAGNVHCLVSAGRP